MRRIVLVAMSTLTVLVLLLGYHTSLAGRVSEQTFATSGTTAGSSAGSSAASSAGSSTNGSTASGGSTTRKIAGSVAQTQWGPVQVQLTVSDGTITAVSLLQQPDGNPRDQEINAAAVPQLVAETKTAQSADIDMVSGATVTSTGYLESLQAALDEAHL